MSENLDISGEHHEPVLEHEAVQDALLSSATDEAVSEEIGDVSAEIVEAPVIVAENTTQEVGDDVSPCENTDVKVQEEPAEPEIKKMKVRTTKGTPRKSKVEDDAEPREPKPKKETLKEKREKEKKDKERKEKEKDKNFFEPVSTDENYVPGSQKKWYILKVQVNREEAIKESLKRRAVIAGYEVFFGDILVPTEKVTEFRGGKKKIIKKKLYPGYLMIFMEITEETWFLVRETPGIGDFAGALGRPTPMLEQEVQKILHSEREDTADSPKLKINFQVGDKIKVKEGTFENFEGDVHQIDMSNGRVTVMINIFGRSTPVELEYWQIETPG